MHARPWIVGGGALAYLLTRSSSKKSLNVSLSGPLPGHWVWPVPRWQGRSPVISDGFDSPRRGLPRHGGVDVMFRRRPSDPFKPGTPNGTKVFVMPNNLPTVAASDGVIWSAMKTPHGYAVVIDHSPRKVATFYTHLERLFIPEPHPGSTV